MNLRRYSLVLSVYPMARGYAFVLFEGPLSPVDWGVSRTYGPFKNERCLRVVQGLFERYRPDHLVLEDAADAQSRRARRIRDLTSLIRERAEAYSIPVGTHSRAEVREHFARHGLATKQGIAESITKHIPAFERFLPPVRKPWMSEDCRMGLFDAAALALTFFHSTASASPPET